MRKIFTVPHITPVLITGQQFIQRAAVGDTAVFNNTPSASPAPRCGRCLTEPLNWHGRESSPSGLTERRPQHLQKNKTPRVTAISWRGGRRMGSANRQEKSHEQQIAHGLGYLNQA
ncbi:MAG: hypothetical protein H6658_14125 [Ardenticatenaceae bacterium]|nr:hypothetical protein [Ardenticatenaceae bacterium]